MGRRRPPDNDELDALQESGHALLSVEGLWCPSCAAATEQVIQRTPGVLDAGVSFATSAALVRWDPQRLHLHELAQRVRRLGYRLGPPLSAEQTLDRIDREIERLGVRLAVAALFGMWTMLLSVLLYLDNGGIASSPAGWWLALGAGVAALPVVIVVGGPILLAGWRTLRLGLPGMDTLASIGVSAALGLSFWQLTQGSSEVYFDTAVMLIVLLTLGRFIETRTLRHAAQAIDALQDTLPETAERLDECGNLMKVPAAKVQAGATIRVAAGQRVPLDGYVLQGDSRLDRSVLSGESLPCPVTAGEHVEAGCINLTSALLLVVDKVVGERRIDRIGARIAEAAGAKGDTQRLADRVARWVVPVALGLALLTLLLANLFGVPFEDALLRAISVLVIACPCAVGIAVPVAYVASASQAARQGILFRHPAALEAMARVNTMLFDKTGTLTEGRLAVGKVILRHRDTALPTTASAILALAARAEQGVDHVIARALRAEVTTPPDSLEVMPQRFERGVRLEDADYGTILVGNRQFLGEQDVECPFDDDEADANEALGVRVEVAAAGHWLASILLQDRLRDDAADALKRLQHAGVECAIVSGDAEAPVRAVASQLGIPASHLFAACTPEAKAAIVRNTHGFVAFAGDGINDGPALAQADVGLAVSESTSTATAAASIAIAEGGVTRIADALGMARRAYRVMRQNLAFALLYNTIGLSLAAFGAIPPVAAAIAMAASSLTVVANASRLASKER
ncbi:Cu+-exporting ATPase [Modicisalibacter ilicicola DSM 19980]|uniref:Cu+-exporting ATPase n=1 Tax=Modicisalibacter ilicicola DSM 19980 TaxID=1121942 RepID=A0A1M5AXF0_9GAMM|nr:cation-translocating P-type ATPase [Halomonas ilicicola]SHF34757.1 Cu+-exporting ATPase [Halomonas ilicicola DSM 19980]